MNPNHASLSCIYKNKNKKKCGFSCTISIDLVTFEFKEYISLPATFSHLHAPYVRTISSSRNYGLGLINEKIKNEINCGKGVLNAVETVIVRENLDLVSSHGKQSFYKMGHKHATRKNLLTPQIPKLKRDEKIFESFDQVRECLKSPFNDPHKLAIRPSPEKTSNFLPDCQIDRDFIILQTAEQRKIMENSTVLNIDQNDECTPEGTCRTLTISAKYQGKH